MSFKCDQCNEACSTNGNLARHKKRCHDGVPVFNQTEMKNKIKNKIVLKLSNHQEIILENSNKSTEKKNFPVKTGKPVSSNNFTQSLEELIKATDNENKTDQLLMILIKQNQEINRQNQELKDRLEKLENKPVSNTLQINNTYNIYLNENTDLYKIFDESKITKLIEICNEKNNL